MIKQLFSAAIIFFVMSTLSLCAQNTAEIDSRLMDKFSKKELKKLSADEISYWTFYVDNCYEIVDIPKEKPDAVPASITLAGLEKKDINVFKLGFKTLDVARDYVRIEGTNKMIVILPQTEIDQKYTEFKK